MRINTRKFKSAITQEQTKEFGMVMVLIISFIAFYLKEYNYIKIAFILTLITILFPVLFYPMALCWFGFGRLLGIISSGILLSMVFIIIVIPIGLIRKIIGYDNLKLKQFKKSEKSLMNDRDHVYIDADLLHTFWNIAIIHWIMEFIKELFLFLKTRKKFWLLPLICILLALAVLIVITGVSALAPLIYTLF